MLEGATSAFSRGCLTATSCHASGFDICIYLMASMASVAATVHALALLCHCGAVSAAVCGAPYLPGGTVPLLAPLHYLPPCLTFLPTSHPPSLPSSCTCLTSTYQASRCPMFTPPSARKHHLALCRTRHRFTRPFAHLYHRPRIFPSSQASPSFALPFSRTTRLHTFSAPSTCLAAHCLMAACWATWHCMPCHASFYHYHHYHPSTIPLPSPSHATKTYMCLLGLQSTSSDGNRAQSIITGTWWTDAATDVQQQQARRRFIAAAVTSAGMPDARGSWRGTWDFTSYLFSCLAVHSAGRLTRLFHSPAVNTCCQRAYRGVDTAPL